MMKRVLAMICAVVLIASVFAACGEKKTVVNGIEVQELPYKNDYSHELYLVMTNKSGQDCDIEVTVNFIDADGKTVDTSIADTYAFGVDSTIAEAYYCSEDFETYGYNIEVKPLSYYDSIDKDLEIKVNGEGEDMELSVTNKSEKTALFPLYYVFFFKGSDLVDVDWGYITDDNDEIKPGATQTDDIYVGEKPFDTYQVYVHSRAEKEK